MDEPDVETSRAGRVSASQAQDAGQRGHDFTAWLERCRQEVETALAAHLKEVKAVLGPHSRLPAAVQYSLSTGGKRLRPILVLEACRVCGGSSAAAMPAALAVELVHTFSLIHDDLPAMDDDDLRRGQPTSHKVFGEAMAILAGDWLLAHAFALLASVGCGAEVSVPLLDALAGGTQALIDGQAADIDGQERPVDAGLVQFIHERKTAALIETACQLGALCAQAPRDALQALARYGRHLGVAFQIADDLLDATGSGLAVGKALRKDAAAAKQTYPAAFGIEESRARARREADAAAGALDLFGARADRLRDLARYVVHRDR